MFDNKSIFVTGGTGSFGRKFIETILKIHNPKKVIVYSRDELKQYEMQQELNSNNKSPMRYFIGDIRDKGRLTMAMQGVDIVVHTAALKQVPATEYNPFEAVKTNVLGDQNVIDASLANNVSKVIALSTDKAAAPINLYGATKLTSDKLFVTANNYKGSNNIQFSVVRYGNVMGSRGSVIPFFLKERDKGVLPITDKNMTRFNITLEQGVSFVMKCFSRMIGGELFIPKIPSYNIMDIAKAIAPNAKHEMVGVRPGEKLHEEMITESDSMNTIEYEDHYVISPSVGSWNSTRYEDHNGFDKGIPCLQGFTYNSRSNKHFLSVENLRDLINEI